MRMRVGWRLSFVFFVEVQLKVFFDLCIYVGIYIQVEKSVAHTKKTKKKNERKKKSKKEKYSNIFSELMLSGIYLDILYYFID